MTREQQRQLRKLNQDLPKLLSNNIRPYKLKKRDFMVWGKNKDIYSSLLIGVKELNGHCYCFSTEWIKPLWIDDLLWDMIDMSENKSQPLSLRCIGAFAIHGATAFEGQQELFEWSKEELEKCVISYIAHFNDTVNNSNMEYYYSVLDPNAYHGEVQEILLLIYNSEYRKAMERIEALETGGPFCNNGIYFKEYARKYCEERI